MKGALFKKRYRIPAALLLALLLSLLLSGTALAWYCFATIKSETTVKESLSATATTEFDANMYPGETNTWTFNIVNSGPVDYTVKADLNFNAPSGVTITNFKVTPFTGGSNDRTTDLTEDNYVEFSIDADKTIKCEMTISAASDAAPGEVSVSLDLSRE